MMPILHVLFLGDKRDEKIDHVRAFVLTPEESRRLIDLTDDVRQDKICLILNHKGDLLHAFGQQDNVKEMMQTIRQSHQPLLNDIQFIAGDVLASQRLYKQHPRSSQALLQHLPIPRPWGPHTHKVKKSFEREGEPRHHSDSFIDGKNPLVEAICDDHAQYPQYYSRLT